MNKKPIDQKWILEQADKLISFAESLKDNSPMKEVVAVRARAIMDLLETWQQTE